MKRSRSYRRGDIDPKAQENAGDRSSQKSEIYRSPRKYRADYPEITGEHFVVLPRPYGNAETEAFMETVVGVVCAIAAILLVSFVVYRDLKKHEERKRALKRRLAEKAAKTAHAQND